MARDGAIYVCQACGAVHAKWAGQCGACQAWNTLVEETQSRPPGALKPSKGRGLGFEDLRSETPEPPRLMTGVAEFDRVCGGGVVPGFGPQRLSSAALSFVVNDSVFTRAPFLAKYR